MSYKVICEDCGEVAGKNVTGVQYIGDLSGKEFSKYVTNHHTCKTKKIKYPREYPSPVGILTNENDAILKLYEWAEDITDRENNREEEK